MQENNTEKRIIRRMKRTFHGQNQEKKKKGILRNRLLILTSVTSYWIFFFFKLVKRPCQYPVIDILAQSGCRGGGCSRD